MAQHARKGAQVQCVTANRLVDGEVVYFTADGSWAERLEAAAVGEDAQSAQALLERAQAGVSDQIVVEPYLFEVVRGAGGIEAVSVRERIRRRGPTVRLDLGKQAV